MKIDKVIQQKLAELGYYHGDIDGVQGRMTTAAIMLYQQEKGLKPDGFAGAMTIRSLMGPPVATGPVSPVDPMSSASLQELHHAEPGLQQLVLAASKLISIEILDSRRGKAAQEAAFNHGFSKVHFGDSAHNYDPCIALDIVPDPLDWKNKESFLRIQRVIGFYNPQTKMGKGLARDMKISIRWLGDPNMDGDIRDGWDFPHYERFPWRAFTNPKNLYKG